MLRDTAYDLIKPSGGMEMWVLPKEPELDLATRVSQLEARLAATHGSLADVVRILDFRTSFLAAEHVYLLAGDVVKKALLHVSSRSRSEDKWGRVMSEDSELSRQIRDVLGRCAAARHGHSHRC